MAMIWTRFGLIRPDIQSAGLIERVWNSKPEIKGRKRKRDKEVT